MAKDIGGNKETWFIYCKNINELGEPQGSIIRHESEGGREEEESIF
jgi:hypothetical protein